VFAQQSNTTPKTPITKKDWDQNKREIQRALKSRMDMQNSDEEEIRKLLGDDSIKMYKRMIDQIKKNMEDSFKDLQMDEFDQEVLKDLNKFFQGGLPRGLSNPLQGLHSKKSYKWKETKKNHILEINIKMTKDNPVKINIEKGYVKLEGRHVIEKESKSQNRKSYTRQVRSINESIPIPRDADVDAVKFENKNEKILVIFPKK
jgi:HSP20 family molecular chaperone IbpA